MCLQYKLSTEDLVSEDGLQLLDGHQMSKGTRAPRRGEAIWGRALLHILRVLLHSRCLHAKWGLDPWDVRSPGRPHVLETNFLDLPFRVSLPGHDFFLRLPPAGV